jgi:hypothetical protein
MECSEVIKSHSHKVLEASPQPAAKESFEDETGRRHHFLKEIASRRGMLLLDNVKIAGAARLAAVTHKTCCKAM